MSLFTQQRIHIQPARYAPGEPVKPALDAFLQHGWFRMRQEVFTTHFLQFNGLFYDAVWLRIPLYNWQPTTGQQKLLKRFGSRLHVQTAPYAYEPALDELMQAYRNHVTFDAAQNIDELLGETYACLFDTQMLQLYYDDRLVAVGFFDKGQKAAAGISSIYHPDFAHMSLGKLLLLYKMLHCQQQGVQYFYPGYIVPGHIRFTYKELIAPAAAEYLDIMRHRWLPQQQLQFEQLPMQRMWHKLYSLQAALVNFGIAATLHRYRMFDATLWFNMGQNLLPYPLVLQVGRAAADHSILLVVYNVTNHLFQLLACTPVVSPVTSAILEQADLENELLTITHKYWEVATEQEAVRHLLG
ncbi:MAG TPA: GNAT family N-acetyltransferase [Phnomibacter sp.]|nr:GNAT family N-acetyltransferase [Phnomibacter sp.]